MKKLLFILIIIIYLFTCYKIYNYFKNNKVITRNISTTTKIGYNTIKREIKGKIIIDKINLSNDLYDIKSKENNVDKNVTILRGDFEEKNGIVIIAAHSGNSKISYFQNLDRLQINDTVKIIYNSKEYTYIIKDIWNTKKTGEIKVPNMNANQLVLTTCSPNKNNYQLIINCILKE